jgi:hypothetical protein
MLLKSPLPAESARAAGLRHVADTDPGIRRRRAGEGFRYLKPDGSALADATTLARIRRRIRAGRRDHARAHPPPGDPAGVDRCLDLHERRRPPAGDRSRCARAQAVPLSRALARSARRN